jgi:UDP-N-acetylglucosamine--N-acetylmuramyl-(pentapeptide) pyrophosphoryl-undecaprenol N-acetylglucosamine transferase
MKYGKLKVIISGGGTGGHIFPALSIADKLKELNPETEILFVGAAGRMEMEKVPAAGYRIEGLPMAGLQRKLTLSNLALPFKVLKSISMAKKLIREFKPDIAIGVGGYASAPLLWAAGKLGVPTLIQEQNGFAGVTNKLLKDKAAKICVAYEGMERFFPADKIILTGNPVRQNLTSGTRNKEQVEKTLLIIGGSLGARTINDAVKAALPQLAKTKIHIVWQTGKIYFEKCKEAWIAAGSPKNIECLDFLSDMPDRYAQADLVISRAGASSISELCLLGKPAILVPSPNVAEDHQTHNAMALVNKDAAVLVRDVEAADKLIPTALELLQDDQRLQTLHTNILQLAQKDSAKRIAKEVIKLAKLTQS